VGDELAEVLAAGEQAAFHGPPARAVESLARAFEQARAAGQTAEATAAAWLLGLSLGASGRYGAALDTLTPLVESGENSKMAELRLFGALAAASLGSVQRQLGRHPDAQESDTRGLALAGDAGEAEFACRLGLAADAVGLGDESGAVEQADAAESLLPDRPNEWWRQRVRHDWVRAEIALLREDPKTAVDHADAAVERAERARAPRHVAKSLLFLGVAQVQAGLAEGASSLRRAATLAEGLGALPLVWPSRAVLGALLAADDPAESATSLATARSAVMAIAADLPPALRDDWLARPDLGALLGS
jgi:hypothetical protein